MPPILCDNGSENVGFAERWFAEKNITQYWAMPHKHKDKPFDFEERSGLLSIVMGMGTRYARSDDDGDGDADK